MKTSPHNISGILAVFLLMILLSCAANAAVFYVKTTGDNGNTGLSWSQAKKSIGSAMSAAAYYDQVWVAAGTYSERVDLKAGVRMYGGFTGTETSLEQRDWRANLTVIDGGNGGSVIKIRNGPNVGLAWTGSIR